MRNSREPWSRTAPLGGTGSCTVFTPAPSGVPELPWSGLPGSFFLGGSTPGLKCLSCRDTSDGPHWSLVWSPWESPGTFCVSCSRAENLSHRVGSQVVVSVVLNFSLSPEEIQYTKRPVSNVNPEKPKISSSVKKIKMKIVPLCLLCFATSDFQACNHSFLVPGLSHHKPAWIWSGDTATITDGT